MVSDWWTAVCVTRKMRDYKPQRVTRKSIEKWLNQFDNEDRRALRYLLRQVIYLDEDEVKSRLVDRNAVILDRLNRAGVPLSKTIYIQIDEAGSSSPVMLNMLKEAARLERRGCRFFDSKDVLEINKITDELGEGAIVYVDDFVGTGNQFCRSRDFVAKYVVGNFSEFLLVPCICEEALYELGKIGVVALAGQVHTKSERLLHEDSTLLDMPTKARLIELCRSIDKKGGLGYKDLATMVVLYRNTPNTVPLLLRGSLGQKPYFGVLPRTQDFLP